MATNRLMELKKVGIYADAMFQAADKSGAQESVLNVRNQLFQLTRLMYTDMELNIALSNPDYTGEQRKELARAVLADCDEALREVVAVMAENDDAGLLLRVYHAYEDEMRTSLDLVVVDVVTAVPLDDALRDLIKKKTEADLGCKAVLNESIDKSILGGIIMSTCGMRIDASVISQLNKARHVLKQTDGGESK